MFNFGAVELVILMLVGPFVLALYFLPAIIAIARHHPNTLGIALLDLFLGWTLLGWLGALIWSLVQIVSPPAAGAAGAGPVTGAVRFCTRCGATLPPDAVFCPACGKDSRG